LNPPHRGVCLNSFTEKKKKVDDGKSVKGNQEGDEKRRERKSDLRRTHANTPGRGPQPYLWGRRNQGKNRKPLVQSQKAQQEAHDHRKKRGAGGDVSTWWDYSKEGNGFPGGYEKWVVGCPRREKNKPALKRNLEKLVLSEKYQTSKRERSGGSHPRKRIGPRAGVPKEKLLKPGEKWCLSNKEGGKWLQPSSCGGNTNRDDRKHQEEAPRGQKKRW